MDDVEIAKSWLKRREEWYCQEEVDHYQRAFAVWNGSKYAFGFMGGRVALSAIINALNLQPGDEVIIPGYTCVVVLNAFHYAGVGTVYCDIELETYGLDAALIEAKITARTKAILIHHLYGLVCRDYEKLIKIAHKHNLHVIEDCAHSTGAEYMGRKVGNWGDVAFYSSEQSKVFNTIQGGIAVTNRAEIAAKLKEFHDKAEYPDETWIERQLHNVVLNFYRYKHPQRWWRGDWMTLRIGAKELIATSVEELNGTRPLHYGRKISAPIAALGLNQLAKIDVYNEERRTTARHWREWCDKNGYKNPVVIPHSVPVFLRYPVLVEPEKKRNTTWALRELGVKLGVWFISNAHPSQRTIEECPNADRAVEQCVNFPGILA